MRKRVIFITAIVLIIIAVIIFKRNYEIFKVSTDSMSPAIKPGATVVIDKSYNELSNNDIICYKLSIDNVSYDIVHRITSISNDYVYTKGDNNEEPDGIKVKHSMIEGKVIKIFNP